MFARPAQLICCMHHFHNFIAFFTVHANLRVWLGTLGVAAAMVALSRVAEFFVKRSATADDARELRTTFRYLLTLFCLFSLGVVWSEQLKHFLFAAAALLAACLIVSKELIMCILGGIVKAYGRLCPIGRVVEIEGICGQVVDSGFLTTSLQTIEHSYTGKIVSFPNSIFLSKHVTQLSTAGAYQLVFVRVPVSTDADIDELCRRLKAIVTAAVAPYQKDAEAHMGKAREELLLDLPSMAPRILLEPRNAKEVVIAARFVCPSNQRSTLEQQILSAFYEASSAPSPKLLPARRVRPTASRHAHLNCDCR